MRLKISKSKNSTSLYVIKTVYVDGKEYTKTIEKLGTIANLEKTDLSRSGGQNNMLKLNRKEKTKCYYKIFSNKKINKMNNSFNEIFLSTNLS